MKIRSFACISAFLLFAGTFSQLTAQTPKPWEDLIAEYAFSGDAQDVSGHGHHGTVYGATPAKGQNEIAETALAFDGVNDYVDLGPTRSLKGKGNSYSVVVNIFLESEGPILSNYHGGPSYSGQFNFNQDRNFAYYLDLGHSGNQGMRYMAKGDHLLRMEYWIQLAFTYDGDRPQGQNIKLYIDGEEVAGYQHITHAEGGIMEIDESAT